MNEYLVRIYRKGGWLRNRDEEFTVKARSFITNHGTTGNTVYFLNAERKPDDCVFYRNVTSLNPRVEQEDWGTILCSFSASEYTIILKNKLKI
jgi:hypothetical protein